MKFEVPVLLTHYPGDETSYLARPLFGSEPVVGGKLLERVLTRLSSALRRLLNDVAEQPRLDLLSQFAYCPNLYEKTFEMSFHHRKRTVSGQFLVVVLPDLEPRIAFCPLFPSVWFHLQRGEDLKTRTYEVLDHFFSKGLGKNSQTKFEERMWTGEVELNFRVPDKPPKPDPNSEMLILGGQPVAEGWVELERVARSLDDQYPQDLGRCLCRDKEVARLKRALAGKARAPQLVVGPRKVGKTAVVHELVRAYRSGKGKLDRKFWLLSPQRLISGMSIVGQWESRLLAILKHAKTEDLVLVFNDLLGLFSAGISRDSNLCVADVLKSYMQRGDVRILAETTNEGLAILREKDRGFADLFTITRLEETSESETLEVVIEEVRDGERLHSCEFELEAIYAALDLQTRYVRDAAFPGKAASFLRKIAARMRSEIVRRDDVLEYFHATSGMALQMLNDRVELHVDDVRAALSEQVLGQAEAVKASTLAVMMAKARLCDPTRPISSLLFVGPTGVGKTECAKALARFLFGDADRLLRFDMNEFLSPGSASRLVGTFHQPDGLLTSAVRRRPFCVILLDEIEKAHHEVFNLLLQVLGDGRLTDARGRTVDFTQTIIIMTSNLGVREASRPIGLRSKSKEEALTYRKAVENFFPPEFFNRLDRVVPFSRLSREDTASLAKGLIKKIFKREGLVRRQCILEVEDLAMEAIVDLGFHPLLGARALKRSIEKSIAGPVSARLTEMRPNSPTVVKIQKREELQVEVQELLGAELHPGSLSPWEEGLPYLDRVDAFLEEKGDGLEDPREFDTDSMTPEQLWYFTVRERIRRSRAISRRLRGYLEDPKPPAGRVQNKAKLLQASDWLGVLDSENVSQSLKELKAALPQSPKELQLQVKSVELEAELALLHGQGTEETATLQLVCGPSSKNYARALLESYLGVTEELELEREEHLSESVMTFSVTGPQAATLAQTEIGFHLFSEAGELFLVEVRERESIQENPRVLRVYDSAHGSLDLRTGWMTPGFPSVNSLKHMILLAFPRVMSSEAQAEPDGEDT